MWTGKMMKFFKNKKPKTIENELDPSNFSSVQSAIGFCVMGLVGALLFTTVAGTGTEKDNASNLIASRGPAPAGVDRTVVGSIKKGEVSKGNVKRYTERRSILQSNLEQVCTIYVNGRESGNC